MGLFKRRRRKNNTVTDEARELSLLQRQENAELKRIQNQTKRIKLQMEQERAKLQLEEEKQRLKDLISENEEEEYEDDDGDDDDENKLLLTLLSGIMAKGKLQPPTTTPTPTPQNAEKLILSEEEIKEFINGMDKIQKKRLKSLPLSLQKNIVQQHIPNISEETLNKGLEILNK